MDYRYECKKYCGGTYCGNGEFDTLDECYEFADDGFCDYMNVYDTFKDVTIKAHFNVAEE